MIKTYRVTSDVDQGMYARGHFFMLYRDAKKRAIMLAEKDLRESRYTPESVGIGSIDRYCKEGFCKGTYTPYATATASWVRRKDKPDTVKVTVKVFRSLWKKK